MRELVTLRMRPSREGKSFRQRREELMNTTRRNIDFANMTVEVSPKKDCDDILGPGHYRIGVWVLAGGSLHRNPTVARPLPTAAR